MCSKSVRPTSTPAFSAFSVQVLWPSVPTRVSSPAAPSMPRTRLPPLRTVNWSSPAPPSRASTALKLVMPTALPLPLPVNSKVVPAAGPNTVSLPAPPSMFTVMGSTSATPRRSAPSRPRSSMRCTPTAREPKSWLKPLTLTETRRPSSKDAGSKPAPPVCRPMLAVSATARSVTSSRPSS